MKQLLMRSYMRNLTVAAIVLAGVLMTFSGCGSSKPAARTDISSSYDELSLTDMRLGLRTLVGTYVDWQQLRVPVTIRVRKPKQISVSGTAIMDRDRSLMISLKYFGMEIGWMYLSSDSVMVVDKIHKSYVKEALCRFLSGVDISVANVQDMLTGRLFVPGVSDVGAEDFSGAGFDAAGRNEWLLTPRQKMAGADYGFRLDGDKCVNAMMIKSAGHQPVSCVYGIPMPTPAGSLAESVGVDYATDKTSVDVTLEWNWKKAKFNADVELRVPVIGNNYKRISSADIAKMLSNL